MHETREGITRRKRLRRSGRNHVSKVRRDGGLSIDGTRVCKNQTGPGMYSSKGVRRSLRLAGKPPEYGCLGKGR